MDEAPDNPNVAGDATAEEVAAVVERLKATLPGWRDGEPIEMPTGNWCPHLVAPNDAEVLHVHLTTRMRPYIAARLRGAVELSRKVRVALELGALYDDETVKLLEAIDAQVHLVEKNSIKEPKHFLRTFAEESVPVTPETRTRLSRSAWARRSEGSSFEKGRRFEGLLGFLLSCVDDFNVREWNLRGATDELDLVLQIANHSPRCWVKCGSPFVLVEAKNWKKEDPVGQKDVTVFHGKLTTKHKVARIGLLFSASGFSSDAEDQILKYSENEAVIVLLGPDEIEAWMDSEDGDEYLESLVRKAMLR